MASYDSDDSLEDENDFTETEVLLGYASKDSKGETISRLGGRPDWLDADKPPTAALARCKACKDLMVLLLQLNAELPGRFPGHERRLYVFACRRKSCRRKEGSIRALRGVRAPKDAAGAGAEAEAPGPAAKEETKQAGPGLGEALFGVKPPAAGAGAANPFSKGPTSSSPSSGAAGNPFAKPGGAAANPFSTSASATPARTAEAATAASSSSTPDEAAEDDLPRTFAEALSLNNPQQHGPPPPPEPWPAEDGQPRPYPVMYLSEAEYETLDPIPLPPPQATTTMDLDEGSGGGGGGGGKEDKVVFESSMDATFQKFADRVGQNPEQCIRYEFGGQPLLYSKADEVGRRLLEHDGPAGGGGMPRCGNCGAARAFEVQLTPQAIAELEAEEEGLEGMDWGTVIVGVCGRDCQERTAGEGEAGYLEEWAGVQWEELLAKR